jgi:hypothetical protein
MNPAKRKRLADKGWRIGDVKEFLILSQAEVAYVETKLTLSKTMKLDKQSKRKVS